MMKKDAHSTTSQLPRVLLQLNPGLSRQLGRKLVVMDKLKDKANKTADYKRRRFALDLEQRREFRQKLYRRHYRIDEETRKAHSHVKSE